MITNLIGKNIYGYIVAILFVIICAIMPLVSSIAIVGLVQRILIFSLITMSLDLIVGYLGLWSFCHATIVGAAAYMTAIFVHDLHITSFFITAPVSLIVAVLFAALLGYISLRVSGLYFLLVTLALGQAFYYTTIIAVDIFGGSDGIYGIPYPQFVDSTISYYYFTLIVCLICFALIYFIVKSPFGYALQGIRDNETKMKVLGYNVWLYKYVAFIVSGFFAAIAGILYVHFNSLIAPSSIDIGANGLPWLYLIIGGAATLWGSITGTTIILVLQYFISSWNPERWPIILGICFVIAVMFARSGIFVVIRDGLNKKLRRAAN